MTYTLGQSYMIYYNNVVYIKTMVYAIDIQAIYYRNKWYIPFTYMVYNIL